MTKSNHHSDDLYDGDELLSEQEIRALVRLLGRVAGSTKPLPARKRLLMDGLCDLVDADMWTWTVCTGANDQKGPTALSFAHNLASGPHSAYLQSIFEFQHPPPYDKHAAREFANGKHVTRRRNQWLSDDEWYDSAFMQKVMNPSELDDFISSIFPLGPDSFSGLAVIRAADKPMFTEREARQVHIVLSEVDWLHYAELPDSDTQQRAPELTPRQRLVLLHLLDGRTRRQIAADLHISEHTANDHVKAVYKRFKVNSHTELMHRFRAGDGGDGF